MTWARSSSLVLACLALTSVSVSATPSKFQPVKRETLKFPFITNGATPVRGVNLGGWFVLEPWITPSIFEATGNDAVVDEWTFGEILGYDEAHRRLEDHWNTWYTQQDFYDMANAGLNFVRIPIGYWSVAPIPGEPYIQGAYDYVPRALDWAQAAGLKVVIDLHGAPGSQNGFDNSGRRGGIGWTQGDTIAQTRAALQTIIRDHRDHPALAGVESLNEPAGWTLDMGIVTQYYYDSWGDMWDTNLAVFMHDAFKGVDYWNPFGPGLQKIVLDTHHYEVFDQGSLALNIDQHVGTACAYGRDMQSTDKWTIAGEWCGAMTDCAKWLNGRGTGARYDGSFPGSYWMGSCAGKDVGSVAALSQYDKDNIRRFIEAQLDAYESAAGWIFWTWKNEGAPEWHMADLVANGVFPQPLTDRRYPHQCG